MPLIKKAFPSISINDIVSVQPMFKPNGLVDYLKNQFPTSTTIPASTIVPINNGYSNVIPDPTWEAWMRDQQDMLKSIWKAKNANKKP